MLDETKENMYQKGLGKGKFETVTYYHNILRQMC